MNDILTTLGFYSVALITLLAHTHLERPSLIKRFPRDHILIALRLSVPFLLLAALFRLCGVSAISGYMALIFFFVISLACWFANYVGVAFFVYAYVFYEFALWFPDKDDWMNRTTLKKDTPRDEGLVGATGVTLTTLKPTGKVEIEGREYEASSEGGFLEAEEPVTVVAKSAFTLVVRPARKQ